MVARAHRRLSTNIRSGVKRAFATSTFAEACVEGTMNKRDKLMLIDARIEGVWRRAKSKGLDRLDVDSLNGLYTLRDRVEKESGSQRVTSTLRTSQKRRRTPRT